MTSSAWSDHDEFDSSDFDIINEPKISAEQDDGETKDESESEVQLNMASEKASTNAAQAQRNPLAQERKKMEDMRKMHSKRETTWTNEKEKLIEHNNCLKKENEDLKSKLRGSVDSEKQKYDNEKQKYDQLMQSMKELEEKATEDIKKKDEELEERDEELEKNKIDYKNEIQEMEDENAALVSKNEELKEKEATNTKEKDSHIEKLEQSVISLRNDLKEKDEGHKNIIQEKEDEYADLTSKLEESSKSEKKKDGCIKKLEQNLIEEEKKYQELANINDGLEEENSKWRKEAKETHQQNIKLQEQMNEMERESRENTRKMQISNEALKAKFEKQKEALEKNNEELDEDNIAQKMKVRKLERDQDLNATDIQQLAKKIEELTNKSDHYENECKDLNEEIKRLSNAGQQLKADFDAEKEKGEKLNRENEILRQRLDERPGDKSSAHAVRSGRNRIETKDDFSHVMSTLSDVTGPTTGSSVTSHPGPYPRSGYEVGSSDHDHGSSTESLALLNQANAQQWYTTEDGEKILSGIFQKLMEVFPLTELSRNINSQDIIIEIKADQTIPMQVRFPSNFPNSSVQIKCGDKENNLKFTYNAGSSHTGFVYHVVSTLSSLM